MPTNSLGLIIIPPKLPSYEESKKPEDWNPKVYDVKSIDASRTKILFTESKVADNEENIQKVVNQ